MKSIMETFSCIRLLEFYKLFNLSNREKMKLFLIALIVFTIVGNSFQGKYDKFKLYFIIFIQKSFSTPKRGHVDKCMFRCMWSWIRFSDSQ